MADLIVTAALLDESIRQLRLVRDEFEGASQRRKDNGDAWGQHDLSEAMRHFYIDWDVRRGKIQKTLADLHEGLESARDTWDEVDEELATQLEETRGNQP